MPTPQSRERSRRGSGRFHHLPPHLKGSRRLKLSIKEIAAQERTSIKSVYRWLADGLEHYDLIGGIKVEEDDLRKYLAGRKKCLSGKTRQGDTTLPSSEGEQEFIESARSRQRGGRRSRRSPNSSSVSTLHNQERS